MEENEKEKQKEKEKKKGDESPFDELPSPFMLD